MKHILLAEDEESFGLLLKNYLELCGYHVTWAKSGTEAYSKLNSFVFDLCILDVMMPHMDGFSLGQKIKKKIPFIYLTAKCSKEDILKGYNIGAEDYLTKPFDTDILIKKIDVILKRFSIDHTAEVLKEIYEIGEYRFNPQKRMLVFAEKDAQKLSPKETLLLGLLCRFQNQIMPRDLALNEIWKENTYFTKRSMDVYIAKLRKHLSNDTNISIETFSRMGFQLTVD